MIVLERRKHMRCALLTVLALYLTLSLCACGASNSTWQEQYDLGVRYLSESNYEEAIIAFTAAIEIEPKRADAYVGRGDAYAGLGGTDEILAVALADYKQAIELDDTVAEPYRKAAEIYVLLGDTDSAIELLKRGVEVSGDADLQAYLDELILTKALTVLSYQAAYESDGTLRTYVNYYYDEQGYEICRESTTIQVDGTCFSETVTFTFNSESDEWIQVPDRRFYNSDKEWENAKINMGSQSPGTVNWISGIGNIDMDPMLTSDEYENVIANGGIRYAENSDSTGFDYTVYTFNGQKLPVEIATYKGGALIGTTVFEWAVIVPDRYK